MKKRKLSLNELKVSSFTTSLSAQHSKTAQGGFGTIGCPPPPSESCEPFTAGHCPFKNDYTANNFCETNK